MIVYIFIIRIEELLENCSLKMIEKKLNYRVHLYHKNYRMIKIT